jgi:hypothetical protein
MSPAMDDGAPAAPPASKRARAGEAPAPAVFVRRGSAGGGRATPPAMPPAPQRGSYDYDSDEEPLVERARRRQAEAKASTVATKSSPPVTSNAATATTSPQPQPQPPAEAVVLDRAAARGDAGREADEAEAASRAAVIAAAAAEARAAREAKRKRDAEAQQPAPAAASAADRAANRAREAAQGGAPPSFRSFAAGFAPAGFAPAAEDDPFGFFGAFGSARAAAPAAPAAPAAAKAAAGCDAAAKKRVRGTESFYDSLNALAARLGGVPAASHPALAALCADASRSRGMSVDQAIAYLRKAALQRRKTQAAPPAPDAPGAAQSPRPFGFSAPFASSVPLPKRPAAPAPPPPPPPPQNAAAGSASAATAARLAARMAEMHAAESKSAAASRALEALRPGVRAALHAQYGGCTLPQLLVRLGFLAAAEVGSEARVRKAYLKACMALHPDAIGRRQGAMKVTPAELVCADEKLKLINSKKAAGKQAAAMED